MLVNLALVVITALFINWCFEKVKIPGLLGMIILGIVFGPNCLGWISVDLLHLSAELRTAALIVILIRAGLGLKRETLNEVGFSALKMSCIPCLIEGFTITLVAKFMLALSWPAAGMLGFIIAAVSPAVVVPQMLDIKTRGYGKNREVPTLILAGASIDDVFAITMFGVFLAAGTGAAVNIAMQFVKVPIGIVLGIGVGLLVGWLLVKFFNRFEMRATKKAIIFMIAAILLHKIEYFKDYVPIASLLGIMAMGFVMLELNNRVANELAQKFNKVWILAEILLFVLIGAQVNIHVAWHAGLIGIAVIAIGLAGRSLGVWLALLGSRLNAKERLFCCFSYFPKATVQAAIGAIPLSMGVKGGEVILAVAVLSIILTAPAGAGLIRATHTRLLEKNSD
ncbi:cation:proton antiporter [Lentisphaerota bacterium ZTH]|nr:cation:proton antiporter [Lentisphaerota bacterium]WET05394.1 cation:proton antiporter [Lentisphaerota bacterium ZTH]